MGRRKIIRSPAEEEQYQLAKRQKKVAYQKAYREQIRNSRNSATSEQNHGDSVPDTSEYFERVREHPPLITIMTHNNSNNNNVQSINENYIGKMDVMCSHCHAKHFKAEEVANKKNSFSTCCSHGEVALDSLPDPPILLKQLFDRSHELSSHFHDRIRCYNNAFAFASFNANLVDFNSNN